MSRGSELPSGPDRDTYSYYGLMRSALAAAAVLALLGPAAARADVGIVLDRTSAHPGDRVRATSARCCYLSLYLVPARAVPGRSTCHLGNGSLATCEPWSIGPPHRPGWIWIGRYRGPKGSLIAGVQTLRIA